MNQHIYRLYQTDFYPFLRIIIPSFIILYLPLSYSYQFPNQWGIGSAILIILISYFGYMALGDIYNNKKLRWFAIDSSMFLVFYFYLRSLLQ